MKSTSLFILGLVLIQNAQAQIPMSSSDSTSLIPTTQAPPAPKAPTRAQRVDLRQVQKTTIDNGATGKVQIIQNRMYSTANTLEFGLMYSFLSTDPFLSVKSLGFSLAYHFTETVALNALYLSDSVSSSQALTDFTKANGFTVNTVNPKTFYGGEIRYSPIYGKLNILDSSIVHFDLHLSLGAGQRVTDSGTYMAFLGGIGQEVFLARWLTLGVDYRLMSFKENIKEKVLKPTLGQVIGTKNELTGITSISLNFLL